MTAERALGVSFYAVNCYRRRAFAAVLVVCGSVAATRPLTVDLLAFVGPTTRKISAGMSSIARAMDRLQCQKWSFVSGPIVGMFRGACLGI